MSDTGARCVLHVATVLRTRHPHGQERDDRDQLRRHVLRYVVNVDQDGSIGHDVCGVEVALSCVALTTNELGDGGETVIGRRLEGTSGRGLTGASHKRKHAQTTHTMRDMLSYCLAVSILMLVMMFAASLEYFKYLTARKTV
jgi:hypothetical protein